MKKMVKSQDKLILLEYLIKWTGGKLNKACLIADKTLKFLLKYIDDDDDDKDNCCHNFGI